MIEITLYLMFGRICPRGHTSDRIYILSYYYYLLLKKFDYEDVYVYLDHPFSAVEQIALITLHG